MKHFLSIKILTAHLETLNEQLSKEQNIIENSEMFSDYHFAQANAANIELNINTILESIEVLRKN